MEALGFDDLGALGRGGSAGGGELGDAAVADDDVVDALDPGDRVEDGGAAEDQVRAGPARTSSAVE